MTVVVAVVNVVIILMVMVAAVFVMGPTLRAETCEERTKHGSAIKEIACCWKWRNGEAS